MAGSSAPLAGRVGEWAALRALVRDAGGGAASTLLVSGETGVGKTALLRQAESEPVRLLWASCLPLTSLATPLLPLRSLYPFGGGDPLTGFDAWLDAQTEDQPTLLVVDDIQWADHSTLDVLLYVIAGRPGRCLATAVTLRTDDGSGEHRLRRWLADVRRLPRVGELRLARLDRAATRDQVEGLLGVPPHESLVDDVQARSRGNPYLTSLLVRGLRSDARSLPAELPTELRDALARAWHGLSQPARAVTAAIAVGGRPRRDFTDADLPLLREAVETGVLRADASGGYWFAHPLVAEVLVGEFLPEERRALHAAFAVEPESAHPNVDEIVNRADHYHNAAMPAPAYRWALRGAEAAEGTPESLRLLRRAFELWPSVPCPGLTEVALLVRIREAARRGGHPVEEVRAVDDLLAREQHPLVVTELLVSRMQLRFWMGVEFAGVAGVAQAQQVSAAYPDSPEHALATAELANAMLWHCDPAAAALAERAVRLAKASGSHRAMVYALIADVGVHGPARIDQAREALELAARIRDFDAFRRASHCLANNLDADSSAELTAIHRQAWERLTALGAPHTHISDMYAAEADGLLAAGEWRECLARLRVALGASPSRFAEIRARLTAALLASRQGRHAEAGAHLARAEELVADASGFLGLNFHAVRAELAAAAGDSQETYNVALNGLTMDPPPYEVERLLPLAARALASWSESCRDRRQDLAGPPTRLTDLRDRFPEVVSDWGGYAQSRIYRRQLRAMQGLADAETARGHRTPFEPELWRAAAASCQEAELIWDEAYCRWRETQAWARDRSARREAVGSLRQAYRMAVDLQAKPLINELEALAASLHAPLGEPEVRAPADPATVPGLTGREREILAYVVAGRTNSEIARALVLSDKTISTHVSNMLRKTGTANRRELAEQARRLTSPNHGIDR
jgi:DNA-binding CsgD family transcriptional regulator